MQNNLTKARAWRALASLFVFAGCLALSACGGGGGDDSPDVSISLTTPSRLEETVSQDDKTTGFEVVAQLRGDVDELDGETVYVHAVDSGGMYSPSPEVFVDSFSLEASMRVNGKLATEAGVVEGTVTIEVCYDAACTRPLKGSPLRVPYKVTVLRGLAVETPAPSYSTPFGASLADQQVMVNLPDGVIGWGVTEDTTSPTRPYYDVDATKVEGTDAGRGTINLNFRAKEPGTYIATYIVTAATPLRWYEQKLVITYTITANPSVDYWFSPSRIDIVRTFGDDQASHGHGVTMLGNTGIELVLEGFEYLSEPAAAKDSVLHNAWWDLGFQAETNCFYDGNNQLQCLPAGTYTGRNRISYVKDGQKRYAYVPVELVVTP